MMATVSDRVTREAPAAERLPVFDLHVSVAGRTITARVRGPLDLHYTPRVLNCLEEFTHSSNRLVMDLRSSDYVDSTGIRGLLMLHKNLDAKRGELRLVVQPGSRVERVIRLLQLEGHFTIYATLAEARDAEPRSSRAAIT